MLNLTEYKNRTADLVDALPWAGVIAPGVVLNKDGSYQRSFAYRGPDLESSTEAELVAFTARFNTILKRFYSGWAMFFEAQRIPAQGFFAGQKQRAPFDEKDAHFESRHLLTFVYLPPSEIADRVERIYFEPDGPSVEPDHARAHLDALLTETDRAAELMSTLLPELAPLDDAQTLTDLHGTISAKQHIVRRPEVPVELDAFLCDTSPAGDVALRLGDKHLRILTVLEFPNTTTTGLFDDLNDLGVSYRRLTLDKVAANKQLIKLRRQWFSKRKSVGAIFREVMLDREAALVDNKAIDADPALQELGADDIAFGRITTLLVVTGKDEQAADEKLLALECVLNGRGFTTIRETLNAVGVWLGSLPSNPYANVRKPVVHTLNLLPMMPASAVGVGPSRNAHLNAPPLMLTETSGMTPFRLDLYVGDVGHTLIVG